MADFYEHDLRIKTLVKKYEKEEAYRLRYQVFVEELGWLPRNRDKKEVDGYDNGCILVGIFIEDKLLACLRILLPFQKFMIEKEFKNILGEHKVRKSKDTIEVTRFCVACEVRKSMVITKYGKFPMIMALEKAFYNWCRINKMDNVYMVVSNIFFRLLNLLGIPCIAVSSAVKMSDGIFALAAISSWSAFERHNEEKRPNLMAWFRDTYQLDFDEMAA